MITFNCSCNTNAKTSRAVMDKEGKYHVYETPIFPPTLKTWVINDDDIKGVKKQPPKTFVIHECSKIKVYQEQRGLKRYFQKI